MALPSFVQSRESLIGIILVLAVVTLAIIFGGATLGIPAAVIGLLFVMYLLQPSDTEKNPQIKIFSGKPNLSAEEAVLVRSTQAAAIEAKRIKDLSDMDAVLQKVRDAEIDMQEKNAAKEKASQEAQQAQKFSAMELENQELTMAINNELLKAQLQSAQQAKIDNALGVSSNKKKPRRYSAPLPGETVETTSKPIRPTDHRPYTTRAQTLWRKN